MELLVANRRLIANFMKFSSFAAECDRTDMLTTGESAIVRNSLQNQSLFLSLSHSPKAISKNPHQKNKMNLLLAALRLELRSQQCEAWFRLEC